jgi:hypothetical protein
MERKGFHIGHFLQEECKKQRYTLVELSKKLNKTEPGIRKDFQKDSMQMYVIDAYANILGLNLYSILAKIWESEHEDHVGEFTDMVSEDVQATYSPKEKREATETVSISFQITESKKEQLLELLTS